jgi:hypothetical protein
MGLSQTLKPSLQSLGLGETAGTGRGGREETKAQAGEEE